MKPVVLACEINVHDLRRRLGTKHVHSRNSILVVRGPLPASVVVSPGAGRYTPSSPDELARWVNSVLGVQAYRGVSPKHAGIDRLHRWVLHRKAVAPTAEISEIELLQLARQWLPDFFDNRLVDFERLRAIPFSRTEEHGEDESVAVLETVENDAEEEALRRLFSEKPKHRLKGLDQLRRMGPPDLFEWCVMFLTDGDVDVRVAVLETMLVCESVDLDLIRPVAEGEEKRIRAAAVAVLARHGGETNPEWFRYGLTDPDTHVRLQTARQLSHLDPSAHTGIFELALYDTNPQIAAIARNLVARRGFAIERW